MPFCNRLRRWTTVAVLMLLPAAAGAAVPHLVKDLNPAGASSYSQILLTANGRAYFVAFDAAGAKALWATDGTVGGTARLTEVPVGAYWEPELTPVGGVVFFLNAADGMIELWRTDGTTGGTARVATLPAAYNEGNQLAKNLTAVGSTLFFSVFASGSGWNLWTSDGTEAGTALVAAIDAYVHFVDFVDFGGVAYFAATDANGTELWRSDGTAAGTEPVADLNPGPDGSYPQEFIVMNGLLYFTATDAATGFEIWSSDGTAAGTTRIGDLNPGSANLVSGPFTTMNGMLFFQGNSGTGPTLWRSDGTAAGTIALGSAYPSGLTPVSGTLFFSATDGTAGGEPWRSDGTPAGTMRIADIRPGVQGSSPAGFHAFGGLVYFSAYRPETGFELWRTDGTAAGTTIVTDLVPGAAEPGGLTDVGGRLLYAAWGPSGRELWQSNGTAAGTSPFFDPTPPGSGSSSLHGLLATNGRLGFIRDATDGTSAPTVWTSDGSAPGTSQATALIGGAIADWNGTLVIAGGTSDSSSYGIWTRSPAGTLQQIFSGPAGSPTIAAGKLFFNDGSRALVSDGTPGGAVALATIPGPTGCTFNHCVTFDSFPRSFVHLGGGVVVFLAFAQNGWELWRTDGTPGGTWKIAGVGLGISYDYGTFEARLMNGRLYFAGSDATGLELWSTDGTAGGTARVADIELGTAGSSPAGFTVLDGRLYFAATDTAGGRELWSSDGTAAGTARVADVEPGTGSADPRDLTVFAGALYFGASETSTGRELWRSDGTAAGTTLVLDIAPGDADGAPTGLTAYGSSLFFSADDGVHGAELWTSDGTPGGTTLFADINSGPDGSAPSAFTAAGDDLFFLAYTPEHGTELWALAVSSACGNGVIDSGENCDDGNAVPGDGCDQDCISELCGDGVLDPGEQCDDGNRVDGDGCSAACLLDCGVAPASGCHEPIASGGARVLLKNVAGSAKDQVQWKWAKGAATLKSEFGAPLATSGFTFCVYDATGAALAANARAGGVCGGKPCWKESATGFSYKRATADGLLQFSLHAGAAGKAKITLKARGDAFTMPSLGAMAAPLTVQLRTGGACWSATYNAPFGTATGTVLKDASD